MFKINGAMIFFQNRLFPLTNRTYEHINEKVPQNVSLFTMYCISERIVWFNINDTLLYFICNSYFTKLTTFLLRIPYYNTYYKALLNNKVVSLHFFQ